MLFLEQGAHQEAATGETTPLGKQPTLYNKVKGSLLPVDEHCSSNSSPTSGSSPQSIPYAREMHDGQLTNGSDFSSRNARVKSNVHDSDNNTTQKKLNQILRSKVSMRDAQFSGSRPKAFSPEGDSDPAALNPRLSEKTGSCTNGTSSKVQVYQNVEHGKFIRAEKTLDTESIDDDYLFKDVSKECCYFENIAEQDQTKTRVRSSKEQMGWGKGRVTASSPAFSSVSYESEHFNELPTVIHVSPKKNIDSYPSLSTNSVQNTRGHYAFSSAQNEHMAKPVLQALKDKTSNSARVSRLRPREKSLSSSPLPSKPSVSTKNVIGRTK